MDDSGTTTTMGPRSRGNDGDDGDCDREGADTHGERGSGDDNHDGDGYNYTMMTLRR